MLMTEDNIEIKEGLKVFYIDFLTGDIGEPAKLELKESEIKDVSEDQDIIMVFKDGRCVWIDEVYPVVFSEKLNADKWLKNNMRKK